MKRFFSFIVSMTFLLAPQAMAVSPAKTTPAAPANWRATPPTLPAPGAFKMPSVVKYELANGLKVELVEDHRVPFTTITMGIRSGTIDDPPAQRGIAAITADMSTEGTSKRSSKGIAEQVDFTGGALSVSATSDFTVVSASGLSDYNDRLFDLMSDVVLNPSFPEDELALKKTNVIAELKAKRAKPEFLAEEKFSQVVYGDHPYAVVAPKPEVIEKMTRQDLVNYHDKYYLPNDAVLVVVGDFRTDEMKALIEKSFGSWKKGEHPPTPAVTAKEQKGRKIYLIDRPGSVQSAVKIGNLGISRNDQDYYACTLANQILGGAAVARLFVNLREHKGYTYGAYSDFAARAQRGHFNARGDVRTDVTAPALKEFLFELDRIRKDPVEQKEILHAKNFLVGSFQLALETQGGLAGRLLEGELYKLPADYLETYSQKIMAVTPEDIKRVSNRLIDSDNLVITVVGDAQKIKGDISGIAPVSVFDTKGGASGKTAGE